ncbi:glycosyltransferase family 4 protein [Salidesulfovibrio brasiliensis]|uniref:glycosyltransferase family 4 protein n=1 Tax=Salidesulfovibrio brasiliensis TaxID=221711 RepID=UPI0006D0ECF6|nr:glycosyltransferase [Salidesulfovibrio brasiliensis]
MRVLNIITGLNTGGAENMLLRLSGGLASSGVRSSVVSLLQPGPLAPHIEALGVPVHSLGMRRGVPSPAALVRLVRIIRREKPDAVLSWLYHADLMAAVATRLAGGVPLAWNLRCSYMDFSQYRRTTAWTVRLCALLSRLPEAVISNSTEAIRFHETLGYRPRRTEVIPNGFDTDRFRPDPDARRRLRASVGAGKDDIVVGLAGRYDAMKDHATFMSAAGVALKRNPALRFVLCGDGVTTDNTELLGLIDRAGVGERTHLFGRVEDMPGFIAGLDMLVLSSKGEAFSNVLSEALCCEVPCVSTDVGESRAIIGESGLLCPPENPEALAESLLSMAAMPSGTRRDMGQRGRERMVRDYALPSITDRYVRFFQSLRK